MHIRLFFILLLFPFATLFAQGSQGHYLCDANQGRFFEATFDSVVVTQNILYSRMPNYDGDTIDLVMDVYEPFGDTATRRPTMLICHGGAFIQGSKTDGSIRPFLLEMAKRGYVIISTNYRLDSQDNILASIFGDVEDEVYKAFFRATQDGRAAYRYIWKTAREDGNPYRIDTNMYYFAGGSAGGILALYGVFADLEEWKSSEALSDTSIFTQLGGLDASGYGEYPMEPYGVFQIAGAIGDTGFIDRNDIPMISQHGTADFIVPFGNGGYTIPGVVNVPLQGSELVHNRLINLGANSVLQAWEGKGHVPWAQGDDEGPQYLDTSLAHVVSHSYALTCDLPAPAYVYFYLPATGRNEGLPAVAMAVYPNPAVDATTLQVPPLNGRYTVDVLDATGRLMRREQVQFTAGQARLLRQDLPVGLYHVIVRADGQAHTAKLVFDNRY